MLPRLNLHAMFREAFGLRRDPFLDTADPAFYYETISCAHAKRRLTECLAEGRGLAVVVGPIGAGKTTLLNAAQEPLLQDDRFLVAVILDPTFGDEAELLEAILGAFGFDLPAEAGARNRKDALKRALFASAIDDGRQAVLFIDEAQSLSPALLESLRSCSTINWTTENFSRSCSPGNPNCPRRSVPSRISAIGSRSCCSCVPSPRAKRRR